MVVGAGITIDTIDECRDVCDGVIIGSWLKNNHKAEYTVNEKYVEEFMLHWNKW